MNRIEINNQNAIGETHQLEQDKKLIEEKICQLLTEFNTKWLQLAYVPCENPFLENEYPLQLNLKTEKKKNRKENLPDTYFPFM